MEKHLPLESWKATLQKVLDGKIVVPNIEALLLDPFWLELERQGIHFTPQTTENAWDKSPHISHFEESNRTYRRFLYFKNSQVRVFESRFLVYRRYESWHSRQPIGSNQKRIPFGGAQGIFEILYNPHAKIPKEGRAIQYSQYGPCLINRSEEEENTTKKALLVNRLIPMGKQGFFRMHNQQQENPFVLEEKENLRFIVGPDPKSTRQRAIHMLYTLAQGKPEDLTKANQVMEDAYQDYTKTLIRKIILRIEEIQQGKITKEELKKRAKEFQEKKDIPFIKSPGMEIRCVDDRISKHGGTNTAILLALGYPSNEKSQNHESVKNGWRNLIQERIN